MPPRIRKDISEDLKRVIFRSVRSGMTYRQLSQQMDVSIGAIAYIMKVGLVCNSGFVNFNWSIMLFFSGIDLPDELFMLIYDIPFRNTVKLGPYLLLDRIVKDVLKQLHAS